MKKPEAAKVVAVLLAAYPNSKITAQTSTVYEESLADLDYEAVDRAVRALILVEPNFMPTVAKIRDMALQVTVGVRRHGGDAWGDVRKAVGRFGRDRQEQVMAYLQEHDPIMALVIDRMGWRELCNSDETDPSYRARFIQLYDLFAADAVRIAQSGGALVAPRQTPQLGRPANMGDLMKQIIGKQKQPQLPSGDDDEPPWGDDETR